MLELLACKRCPKCGETKPAETGFYVCRTSGDGFTSKCRECFKRYYAANRARRLAYQLAYNRRVRHAN